MNSDQLLHALADCAQASTHEPDAETINAAIERIKELEAKLAAAESKAWNAAIDQCAKKISRHIATVNDNELDYLEAIRFCANILQESKK